MIYLQTIKFKYNHCVGSRDLWRIILPHPKAFKYNHCVGSRHRRQSKQGADANLNTTIVSVQEDLKKQASKYPFNLNTTIVSVQVNAARQIRTALLDLNTTIVSVQVGYLQHYLSTLHYLNTTIVSVQARMWMSLPW